MSSIFRIDRATVVDLVGDDSVAILNNLTTNHVKALPVGSSCETFVTDVRGKMLAHVVAFRTSEGYRLIGAAGQAQAIVAHVDRYTIREDARPIDRSEEMVLFVIAPDAMGSLYGGVDWPQCNSQRIDVAWLGHGSAAILTDTPGAVEQVLRTLGQSTADEERFHIARTKAGFPWFGIDLTDKNLPQEASRIEQSISFHKGCYLGQETIARLDALGQVQKQLMRWETQGAIPEPGCELTSDGKVVGRLTSIAPTGHQTAVAIGMTRRSHFESGAQAEGQGFVATVV